MVIRDGKKKDAWLASLSELRAEGSPCLKYFTALRSEASSNGGAAPMGLPLLQGLDEPRVGLDASTFSFHEPVRIIERHPLIADEVRDDNGGAS